MGWEREKKSNLEFLSNFYCCLLLAGRTLFLLVYTHSLSSESKRPALTKLERDETRWTKQRATQRIRQSVVCLLTCDITPLKSSEKKFIGSQLSGFLWRRRRRYRIFIDVCCLPFLSLLSPTMRMKIDFHSFAAFFCDELFENPLSISTFLHAHQSTTMTCQKTAWSTSTAMTHRINLYSLCGRRMSVFSLHFKSTYSFPSNNNNMSTLSRSAIIPSLLSNIPPSLALKSSFLNKTQ